MYIKLERLREAQNDGERIEALRALAKMAKRVHRKETWGYFIQKAVFVLNVMILSLGTLYAVLLETDSLCIQSFPGFIQAAALRCSEFCQTGILRLEEFLPGLLGRVSYPVMYIVFALILLLLIPILANLLVRALADVLPVKVLDRETDLWEHYRNTYLLLYRTNTSVCQRPAFRFSLILTVLVSFLPSIAFLLEFQQRDSMSLSAFFFGLLVLYVACFVLLLLMTLLLNAEADAGLFCYGNESAYHELWSKSDLNKSESLWGWKNAKPLE